MSATLPPDDLPDWDDRFLPRSFGRFLVLRQLAAGRLGAVFLARDTRHDHAIALKLPHARLLRDDAVVARFRAEARALSRLHHPHLCRHFDAGAIDGRHYLAMAFVDGGALNAAVAPTPATAADLTRTLALALEEAHRADIVHGDLRPNNVLVASTGQPIIAGFSLGLLSAARTVESGAALIDGAPPFVAPEQLAHPEAPGTVVADVYGLGRILCELLRVRQPDGARAAQTNGAAPRQTERDPLADVDPELVTIAARATAATPAARFPSMHEFADALEDYLCRRSAPAAEPVTLPRETIRLAFVGANDPAPALLVAQDRLYLDVGHNLRPGMVDHHHATTAPTSTTRQVLNHPELVRAAIKPWRRSGDPFTVVLPTTPGVDAVAATFLAVSQLTRATFPEGAELVADYVDRVESGRVGLSHDRPISLLAGIRQLAHRAGVAPRDTQERTWKEFVSQGMRLMRFALHAAFRAGQPIEEIDVFACAELFDARDRDDVRADLERYRAKLHDKQTRARRARLQLPTGTGQRASAEAIMARDVQGPDDPGRVLFFRDWAASDRDRCPASNGFVVTVMYASERPGSPRRSVIAVRPAAGVTLEGLGDLLDRAEAERRRHLFGQDDRPFDPPTQPRLEPGPGLPNADPWYDGRVHWFTRAESPRSGTFLTADEIENIVLEFGNSTEVRPID